MQYPKQGCLKHELLPCIAFGLYESQKQDFFEEYGQEIVEATYEELINGDYSSIIERLQKLF